MWIILRVRVPPLECLRIVVGVVLTDRHLFAIQHAQWGAEWIGKVARDRKGRTADKPPDRDRQPRLALVGCDTETVIAGANPDFRLSVGIQQCLASAEQLGGRIK